MNRALVAFLWMGLTLQGQEISKEYTGKEQPGAIIEHFVLKGGRVYDGIWDADKSRIHVVQKSNHVANLAVSADEILTRRQVGDGSRVKVLSDVDVAEKVLLLNRKNYGSARTGVAAATQKRDALHQFYHGKSLPKKEYNAVMIQYKAADDAVANAQKALETAQAGFNKALEAYRAAGGKTEYTLP